MVSTDDSTRRARDALDRHAWDEAYDLLTEADEDGSLLAEGLEMLASAAYWTGRPDATIDAYERAYAAYLDEGNPERAAMVAFQLASQHGMRMQLPQAQGWGGKAVRLAEADPDWPVNGWLIWMQGLLLWIMESDFAAAIERYDEAIRFAERSGDRDLSAMSLHDKGHALCLLGEVERGMPILDECMATVVGGELDPAAAGYVYCGMIGICSKLGDYGRATQWTESTLRWCERQSVPGFPGVCRVHRAELRRFHGELTEAERDAVTACEELPRYAFVSELGPAYYEIGEARRMLGDSAAADEAYARAEEFGKLPEPGRSLLRLAEGKVQAAGAGIRRALTEVGNPCLRVRLARAQVEIAIADDDLDTASAASDELDTLVEGFGTASLRAMASGARGAVLAARGDTAEAIPFLQRARNAWLELDAPLEAADTRLVLARAFAAIGDEDAARREARAAREAFEQVGARPGAETARRFLDALTAAGAPAERLTRAFMFTDIVRSTDLIGVIGDEAWEDLLGWHDRTFRSLFASYGGQVGHPTGDGFFVAFPEVGSALRCAVEVQRALSEHRRAEGFSLSVRIGIHAGEATRRGEDYGGAEVHRAARIAALAEGGEIYASRATVDAAGIEIPTSDVGEVELKGFTDRTSVVRITWRES